MSTELDLKECLFKELDIVEDIINRMATYSFMIKGWTITLVVISLLLSGTKYHHILAFVPWILFWYLDARYLHLEKCYRAQYDWLIKNRLTNDENLFRMNAKEQFKDDVACIRQTMISWSLLSFYGLIFLLIVSILALYYFGFI